MALTRAGVKAAFVAALQNQSLPEGARRSIDQLKQRADVREAFALSTKEGRLQRAEAFLASDPATWTGEKVSEAIRDIMEFIDEIPA